MFSCILVHIDEHLFLGKRKIGHVGAGKNSGISQKHNLLVKKNPLEAGSLHKLYFKFYSPHCCIEDVLHMGNLAIRSDIETYF